MTMPPILLAEAATAADDLTPYIPVIVILLLGGAIAVGLVALVSMIGTRSKSFIKAMPFEAGSVPVHGAWKRIHVRYYAVALLFIVFDLETVFLVIWGPVLQDLGPSGLASMGLFVLLLAVGLIYEWGKGVLDWNESDSKEKAPARP